MTDFVVTCGATEVQIVVETHPAIRGGPVYLATPYIVRKGALEPLAGSDGRAAALHNATEAAAAEDAAQFLNLERLVHDWHIDQRSGFRLRRREIERMILELPVIVVVGQWHRASREDRQRKRRQD